MEDQVWLNPERIRSNLQTGIPEGVAQHEHCDQVATPATEHEHVATVPIFLQGCFDFRRQGAETGAHAGGAGGQQVRIQTVFGCQEFHGMMS
nr:hypothetical protein [Massilia niastensis]